MDAQTGAAVRWCARRGLGRGMRRAAEEALGRRPGDGPLLLARGLALLQEGAHSEALRALAEARGAPGMARAAAHAAIHAHLGCRIVDEEAVQELRAELAGSPGLAEGGARGLFEAAECCLQLGDVEVARGYLEDLQKSGGGRGDPQELCLAGWLKLEDEMDEYGDTRQDVAGALGDFNAALGEAGGGDAGLEAILGKARCYEVQGQYELALAQVTEATAAFPWFAPVRAERARIHLALGDWELCHEAAQQALAEDPADIQALFHVALYELVRRGNAPSALETLRRVAGEIEKEEPRNHALMCAVASPIVRACGRDPEFLKTCRFLLEGARRLAPEIERYSAELALVYQGMRKLREAADLYAAASNDDSLGVAGIEGTIHCQLMMGDLADAAGQLEFLQEMGQAMGSTVASALLNVLLLIKRSADFDQANDVLDDALSDLREKLSGVRPGPDHLTQLQPHLLLDVAEVYLESCGSEPRSSTEPPAPQLKQVKQVLQVVLGACPGNSHAMLLGARSAYLDGDMNTAQRKVNECLKYDSAEPEALILLAHVFLHQDKPRSALQAMENAIAQNFRIRELPAYSVVRAHVHKAQGEHQEAVDLCRDMMSWPNFHSHGLGDQSFTLRDKASICVILAEGYDCLGKREEATQVVEEGIREFEGTREYVRLLIAYCNNLLAQDEADKALKMLEVVPMESEHYIKAKMAMADIFLKHKRDKVRYAACYMELVEQHPDAQTYNVLGEAYLQIQEPAKAVGAFESALKLNPRDSKLTSKIGKALLATHDFQKAIDYYESSIRNDRRNHSLKLELAKLYYKMNYLDHAETLAKRTVAELLDEQFTSSMAVAVKLLLLLADVGRRRGGSADTTIGMLQKAKKVQAKILQKVRREQPDLEREQSENLASICDQLGRSMEDERRFQQALENYQEGLSFHESSVPLGIAVARVYRSLGKYDECTSHCHRVIGLEGENEDASGMLAELNFAKGHFESAVFHFMQLLEKNPANYSCLATTIDLLYRTGQRAGIEKVLRDAEQAGKASDPGMQYCLGLSHYLGRKPFEALQHLNRVRKDPTWSNMAIEMMIKIYLNPDQDTIWEEVPVNQTEHLESVAAAQKLLLELRSPTTAKHQVLQASVQMASRSREAVERALNTLVQMYQKSADSGVDNVPVLLAMSVACLLLKQTPKARNQLKRLAKANYSHSEAEEFEMGWLMLVELYVQGGKFDMAQELCKKCLHYNKSCSKAHEHLGAIAEREQAYEDAADSYSKAWDIDNGNNPTVGFKLAFNHLKAKRFVEAIDVGNEVLAKYPQYPKIRKEVIEKAGQLLRS